MRGCARLGDKTLGGCSTHGSNIGGTIVSASGDVIINDRGAARLADRVVADCGCESLIVSCAPSNFANDRGIARLADQVAGSTYSAIIVTASSDTFTTP